jgi:hypothetical protein
LNFVELIVNPNVAVIKAYMLCALFNGSTAPSTHKGDSDASTLKHSDRKSISNIKPFADKALFIVVKGTISENSVHIAN